MHSLGVRGNVHALMACYLADSKQFVNVNSENSKLDSVERGVPQGSILGPLLFLVYINDIGPNSKTISKLLLYADNIVFIENSPSETGGLNFSQTWLALIKVDLIFMKSKFVFFSTEQSFMELLNLMNNSLLLAGVTSAWESISMQS